MIGPACSTVEELEKVAEQLRADLDALLCEARSDVSNRRR
jgi:hypothetical protein